MGPSHNECSKATAGRFLLLLSGMKRTKLFAVYIITSLARLLVLISTEGALRRPETYDL